MRSATVASRAARRSNAKRIRDVTTAKRATAATLLCVIFYLMIFRNSSVKTPSVALSSSNRIATSIRCETTKGAFTIRLNVDDPVSVPHKSIRQLVNMTNEGFWSTKVPIFRVNHAMIQLGRSLVRRSTSDLFTLTQFSGAVQNGALKHMHIDKKWSRDVHPAYAKRDEFGNLMDDLDETLDKKTVFRSLETGWKRGDLGMIGGTQMVLVKESGTSMGKNRHDTVVGRVSEVDVASVVDSFFAYNDVINHPHGGPGPAQGDIFRAGNEFLKKNFPLLDYILGCDVVY